MILDWYASIDWSATGAMIGGLSTTMVAILTIALIKENRLLRKAGNSPRVVAHFEMHPDGTGGLNMALSNVGTGPAFDVSFSFERKAGDFENYNIIVDYSAQRPTMTMIAQGEKISFLFAIGFNLFQPKDPNVSQQLKPFHVKVNWRASGSDEQLSEKYQLDVSAYAGLPGMMNKPHLMRIADELADIKKQIVKLATRSSGLASFGSAQLIDATKTEQRTRQVVKGNPSGTGEESS